MNVNVNQISNGYLVTVAGNPQTDINGILWNVKFIAELNELEGAVKELQEEVSTKNAAASKAGLNAALASNREAAGVAMSQGPRN